MDNRQKNDYKVLYESLTDRYCRLLFITGPQEARSAFLHQIPDHEALIQVSQELVKILHTLPTAQQTKAVTDFFVRLGEGCSAVFLSDLEILFDRSLSIDPIKLLKTAARNRAMVVEWPGEIDFSANTLNYAESVHSEYFSTELTDDVLFFDVSGRNTLNKTADRC